MGKTIKVKEASIMTFLRENHPGFTGERNSCCSNHPAEYLQSRTILVKRDGKLQVGDKIEICFNDSLQHLDMEDFKVNVAYEVKEYDDVLHAMERTGLTIEQQ